MNLGHAPSPSPGTDEVQIAVRAAGVNRADLLQRRGLYPPPAGASDTLGLEVAGTVREVGHRVEGFQVGDRVMALLAGGGYAELAVAHAGSVMNVPEALDDVAAAAVPEVFITAYLNLFLLAGLRAGEVVLVHGGSGGVGTASIQLATRAGARVVVTAGSPKRCQACRDLGADQAFDHRTEDFAAGVLAATGGRGADVILDCIGARYLSRHLECLATDGRLVVIGLMGGARAELDLGRMLRRRIAIIGSTLRSLSARRKAEIIGAFFCEVATDLDSGSVRPVVDRVVPIEQVGEAHRALAAGEIFGKVVLSVG
jgi:putative PIG3 family NAD(P)H quinone oxidoreductase